jgi:hypothetical protein
MQNRTPRNTSVGRDFCRLYSAWESEACNTQKDDENIHEESLTIASKFVESYPFEVGEKRKKGIARCKRDVANFSNKHNNKNKHTVCSPSPVVLTKRIRRARDSFTFEANSSTELCNQRSSSKGDPFPFCTSTSDPCWERMRAVRLAQAFARPDCVEYKIRHDVVVISFVVAVVVDIVSKMGIIEATLREDLRESGTHHRRSMVHLTGIIPYRYTWNGGAIFRAVAGMEVGQYRLEVDSHKGEVRLGMLKCRARRPIDGHCLRIAVDLVLAPSILNPYGTVPYSITQYRSFRQAYADLCRHYYK